MQLRYEQLTSHLQKTLAPIYLISGDVPLLAQESTAHIRAAAKKQDFGDRQLFQVETGFSWQAFAAATNNYSLFASKQLLELRFTPTQLGDAGSKALQAYAQKPPEDKILLINTPKLDATQQKSAWVQAIIKCGVFIQIWPLTLEQLPNWIQQRLNQAGLQVDKEGIALLAARAEGNLLAASQEIEKLRLMYADSNIHLTTEIIAEVVANSARYDIFQFANCAVAGDGKRACQVLASLREEGVEPVLILWALAREIRTLATIRYDMEHGTPLEHALQKHYIRDNQKPSMRKALQRHNNWRQLLQQASKVDQIIKGIEIGNVWNEIERLGLGYL